jgi:peptidoglycan hydrolase CwlO-like protein
VFVGLSLSHLCSTNGRSLLAILSRLTTCSTPILATLAKVYKFFKQYAKVKDEIEAIDYKNAMAKYQLDGMNNQIKYLNRIRYSKRNEIAYLKIEVQELERYVHGLDNHEQ